MRIHFFKYKISWKELRMRPRRRGW